VVDLAAFVLTERNVVPNVAAARAAPFCRNRSPPLLFHIAPGSMDLSDSKE
jgi:hypothetical protein